MLVEKCLVYLTVCVCGVWGESQRFQNKNNVKKAIYTRRAGLRRLACCNTNDIKR